MYLRKALTNINKKHIMASLIGLTRISREEAWELAYDKETDALYYSPSKLPDDAKIVNISKEMAVYINSNSDIKGIFIENFSSNFVKHNKEFEELLKILSKKEEDNIFVAKNSDKSDLYEKALSATLLDSLSDKNNLIEFGKRFTTC